MILQICNIPQKKAEIMWITNLKSKSMLYYEEIEKKSIFVTLKFTLQNTIFTVYMPRHRKWPKLLRPKSFGSIRLSSKNYLDHPIIDPQYLKHPDDVKTLVEALKIVKKIFDSKHFK